MATPIVMPQLGESVTEGTIGRWLKRPGDRVEKFEPLVEVITDKVTAEVPSPAPGVIRTIAAPEGATVKAGAVIAELDEARGDAVVSSTGAAAAGAAGAGAHAALAGAERPDGERGAGGRFSPAVRRLAREHQIDLAAVRGTGTGGRVTRTDVLRHVAAQAAARAAAPASLRDTPAPAEPLPLDADEERLPLTPMRRAIAERLSRSRSEVPHAWTMVEADVTDLVRLRQQVKDEFRRREGVELTFIPFLIKAAVAGLKEVPIVNSAWGGDHILRKRRIHIGVAVSLPGDTSAPAGGSPAAAHGDAACDGARSGFGEGEGGLIVPVIRDADQRSVAGLAHAVADLAERARSGRLTPDDVQGGTFTVNNTGSFGSIASAPILNHPQAAILTLEAIVKRPAAIGDAIGIRAMVNLCLSFDHRVFDGAVAGRFLRTVRRTLEGFGPGVTLY